MAFNEPFYVHNYDIVSTSPDVVAIINDDFLILDCSDHFADFFEFSKSLIIKKEFTDFVVLRERETRAKAAMAKKAGNRFLKEVFKYMMIYGFSFMNELIA